MEEYKESYKDPVSDFEKDRVDLPDTFRIICCPNCASEVPADNLNINDKIGKCGSCQAVFSIEKDIQGLQLNKQKIKQEILRPEGIELFEFKEEMEISFEQPMTAFEWVMFTVVMIAFMGGSIVSVESKNIYPFLFIAIVPTVLSLLYYIRRKSKHRKFITIDDHYLDIIWRPNLFNTNQRYAINDISQLYVKPNPNMGDWQLIVIIDEGHGQKHVKLSSVNSISKAKYLEQVIEAQLGIQDVVVPEES